MNLPRLRTRSLLVLSAIVGLTTMNPPKVAQAQYSISCELSLSATGVCGEYNVYSYVSAGTPPGVTKTNTTTTGDGYTCTTYASSYSTPATCGPWNYTYWQNGNYTARVDGSAGGSTCSQERPVSVTCH